MNHADAMLHRPLTKQAASVPLHPIALMQSGQHADGCCNAGPGMAASGSSAPARAQQPGGSCQGASRHHEGCSRPQRSAPGPAACWQHRPASALPSWAASCSCCSWKLPAVPWTRAQRYGRAMGPASGHWGPCLRGWGALQGLGCLVQQEQLWSRPAPASPYPPSILAAGAGSPAEAAPAPAHLPTDRLSPSLRGPHWAVCFIAKHPTSTADYLWRILPVSTHSTHFRGLCFRCFIHMVVNLPRVGITKTSPRRLEGCSCWRPSWPSARGRA